MANPIGRPRYSIYLRIVYTLKILLIFPERPCYLNENKIGTKHKVFFCFNYIHFPYLK
jgi:hypothetical protein